MARYRSLRDIDWGLLVLTLSICALGILQIFSATYGTEWKDAWWKQLIWVFAGFCLMWLLALLDYHNLLDRVPLLYGISLLTLVGVLVFGSRIFGSKRWIPLFGGFHIQVSEFVKLVIILLVARYLTELRTPRLQGRDLIKLGALVAIPTLLVMKQPDLGTALTYGAILAVGIFLAGLPARSWLAIGLLGLALIPVGWSVLKDYQKQRLYTFLDPGRDPRGAGYQVIQSKIAVGSGGMWGKGVTHGSQTQLRFLPVPHTDFIFSAFGEEHGFVGVRSEEHTSELQSH